MEFFIEEDFATNGTSEKTPKDLDEEECIIWHVKNVLDWHTGISLGDHKIFWG